MSLLSTALFVVGATLAFAGVVAMVVPGRVRSVVPAQYAASIGGRREWRGFGAGLAGFGGSMVIIAVNLPA